MPLFERSNKVAVVTEIERSIRTLESKSKTAQTSSFVTANTSTEIERLIHSAAANENITPEQAENYRSRIEKSRRDFERLERTETRDVVNDFENPRENAARHRGLENYKAEIESEKAKELKAENNPENKDATTRSGDERII